jgi:hypothetical protein
MGIDSLALSRCLRPRPDNANVKARAQILDPKKGPGSIEIQGGEQSATPFSIVQLGYIPLPMSM